MVCNHFRTRLVTSIMLMLAIVLTWFFGILAVNHTEDKIYHYVFIVFYTFQVREAYLPSKCLQVNILMKTYSENMKIFAVIYVMFVPYRSQIENK